MFKSTASKRPKVFPADVKDSKGEELELKEWDKGVDL